MELSSNQLIGRFSGRYGFLLETSGHETWLRPCPAPIDIYLLKMIDRSPQLSYNGGYGQPAFSLECWHTTGGQPHFEDAIQALWRCFIYFMSLCICKSPACSTGRSQRRRQSSWNCHLRLLQSIPATRLGSEGLSLICRHISLLDQMPFSSEQQVCPLKTLGCLRGSPHLPLPQHFTKQLGWEVGIPQ